MKKQILSAALLALVAFTSNAQNVIYAGCLSGGTNNVAGSTTNTYWTTAIVTNTTSTTTNYVTNIVNYAAFTVPRSRIISIQPSLRLDGSGTTAVPITFDNSVDGANWKINITNMTVTPAGTVNANSILTLDTGGVMFWRVGTVGAPTNNAASITNLAVPIGKRDGL